MGWRAKSSPHTVIGTTDRVFRWLTTTNTRRSESCTSRIVLFFIIAGVLALLMRTELALPGPTIVDATRIPNCSRCTGPR